MDKSKLFEREINDPDFIEKAGLNENERNQEFGADYTNKYLRTLETIIKEADENSSIKIFNKIKNSFRINSK